MKKSIFNQHDISSAIDRIAGEIISAGSGVDNLVLVGIRTGGAFLAKRLQGVLEQKTAETVPTGVIDINLYRDDWTRIGPKPVVGKTELNFSIDDKRIVLVDDVLFTGRTVRSALNALTDFGRPAKIELAVLVDRGHRELPISADYKGLVVETTLTQRVNVYFHERGEADDVALEEA